MQVILMEDVKSLGKKGQLVEVSDGYGTNFLLPKKKAILATKSNLNEFKQKEKAEEHRKELEYQAAQELAEKLKQIELKIPAKMGDNGKLFGSVTNKEIASEIEKQHGIKIDKKKIVLEDTIKNIGAHKITVKLHSKVAAKLNVQIVEV